MDFGLPISDFRFLIPEIADRRSKIKNILILVISLSVSIASASAAEESGEDAHPFVIKSIEIQGSETMPAETVLGILQTRVGEEVSQKRIRDDVKELFKLGQFSNIQVDSSGSKAGIDLTFILEEYPKVRDVSLNGHNDLSEGMFKDVLTIGSGRSLSGRLLHENKSKIVSLYQKKGYYLVQVEPDVVIDTEDESVAGVTFNISEGKKIEVEEVDIIGNRRISDREIKKQMKIRKGKRFDDDYFEGDLKAIEKYYHEKGFVNAKTISAGYWVMDSSRGMGDSPHTGFWTQVTGKEPPRAGMSSSPSASSFLEETESATGFTVRIEVEEGPQFRVGRLRVYIEPHEDGEPLFTEKQILKQFTLEEGDVFSQAVFDEGIAKISKMYFDKGRVSVQINQDRNYNSEEEAVDLTLKISEGGPAYIESAPINWVSQASDEPHKTREYIIRRELDRFDVKKGELFSSQNIEDARRKILTLGSFIRRAQPQPRLSLESDSEDGSQRVIVNFDLEESRQSGMFSIAGGYGSEGGVFGALDIWDDNIMGRAWRLHIRGEIGTRERRTGQIYFSTPWIFNSPTSLHLSLYSRRRSTRYYPGEEEEALYRDESVGGSVTIGRPLTRRIDLSVGLRNEKASSKELLGDVWEEIYSGDIRSIKLIVDRDTRRFITSMFDPNSGTYNTFSAEYSGLGGDKFQEYMTESSLFIPTWWKFVLVFHLRTGYLGGEDIKLMRYERFFLGGIDSVRGYDQYSITPSSAGDPERYYEKYGGNQMALLNVEYRFPITDMLRGLIFFDAGQTWADNEWPWDNFRPRKSVGIGLRIDLLGALARLEYGYPLDPAREGESVKGGKIQFDIGPAF
jgi:outer membrane protein insertion porin family